MARNKGTFNFAANFEPLLKAPLDARMLVSSYEDLINPLTWQDTGGLVWLFDGAIVVVKNDPSSGIYWLKDSANYTDYASWQMAGGVNPLDPSTIQDIYAYVDASLLSRDVSIADLYSKIDLLDSSINYLINWNTSQDASIINLDASISQLFSRNIINIGDGSANIFAGYDASGNIQLRTLLGSGAATVTEIGDKIIIGIDASFGGEINYGENVGDGDASIYVQKIGDALQFRELSAGPNITLDVSNNVITIGSTGASSTIDGGVWISDIIPSGSGNVGDKVFVSSGEVLASCLTDTTDLRVDVIAVPGHSNYEPSINVYGIPVTNLSLNLPGPQWTGYVNISFNSTDSSITAIHEDGASWTTVIAQDTPAVIFSADFINGYPGSQTELKAGDTYQVRVQTDVAITQVIVDDFGAATGGTYNVSGNDVTFTVTIANRGTSTQALGLRLRVVKSTGSTSAPYLTSSQGSVNGKDLVNLNNTVPIVSISTITYPPTQSALKNSEIATVANTVTSTGTLTYSYTSPNGDLTITSPNTYQTSKTVTRSAGSYNVSATNFTLTATRTENNSSASASTIVYIANIAPTLTVVNGVSRFRSGGNDGTSAQNHTITIQSSQRLQAAPTLVSPSGGGTWQGTGFSWGLTSTSFTRSLQVHDNDLKGTYSWGAISGIGLAGLTQTSNSGAATYVLGGFVQRNLTVEAYGTTATFHTEAVDYSKISSTLNWSVKLLTNKRSVGTTTTPDSGGWSIDALNINPTTINILDTEATSSSSQPSTITGFEETI